MDKATLKQCSAKLQELETQIHAAVNQADSSLLEYEGAEDLDEIDQSNNLNDISRLKSLKNQYNTRLLQIEAAKKRMQANMFGTCLVCEEDIPTKRLLANPLAIRCLECQEDMEKVEKENKQRSFPAAAERESSED